MSINNGLHGGNGLTKTNAKPEIHQKPFRCPVEMEIRINKAKGALMLSTGERISDNQFIVDLLNLGLKSLKEQLGSNDF